MAAYSKQKKEAIKDKIEDLVGDYFDRYTLYDILQEAEKGMEAQYDAVRLADTLYDFIRDNYSDYNVVISASLEQCMPKSELMIFRNELIKEINKE